MSDPTPEQIEEACALLPGPMHNTAHRVARALSARDRRIAELEGRHHLTLNTDFFDWLANRLVKVYGESPNTDFVRSLRKRAKEAACVGDADA